MSWLKGLDKFLSDISDQFFSSNLGQKLSQTIESMFNQMTGSGTTGKFEEELAESEASNDRLAENAYQRNVDFYERFQSPAAQVRQYKEAGLNPALMYGSGASVSASNVASPGSASASGETSLGSILGFVSGMMNLKAKYAEMNIEKDLGYRNAEIGMMNAISNNRNTLNLGTYYGAAADRESAEADRIRALYPAQKDEIVALADYYRDLLKNNDFQRRLAQSNIDLNEAERGIKAYQSAILAAQEKYADKYYDLVNKRIQLENALTDAETAGKKIENRFLRRTLQNRIDAVDYELKDLIITAGIHAKDFNTYEQRRVQSWIDTGAKVFTAGAAGAGAFFAGKKIRGMGAPTVGTYPAFEVSSPTLKIDPDLLRTPNYRLF